MSQRHLLITALTITALTIWAATWGYAEILTIAPRNIIKQWEEHLTDKQARIDEFDKTDWQRAWNQLETARTLNGLNAEHHLGQGRLAELRARIEQTPAEIEKYGTIATNRFQEAIQKRPSWGLAWAYLATNLSRQTTANSTTLTALINAMIYAPYEKEVQHQVIPLGMKLWEQLPENMKNRHKNIIRHALRFDYQYPITQAVQNQWIENIRPLLSQKRHHNHLARAIKNNEY